MKRLTDADLAAILVKQGKTVDFKFKKNRKPRDNEESRIQGSLVKWWAVAHVAYKLPEFALFSIPNGGWRDPIGAAILKREGLRPGVSDMFLARPIGKYHGLFLELKAPNGKVSDEQSRFIIEMTKLGYSAGACYSLDQAVKYIADYLAGDEFF